MGADILKLNHTHSTVALGKGKELYKSNARHKQKEDALGGATCCRCNDAPNMAITELRPSKFRGNRAVGAVVKATAPIYKMKCPSLRKMTRNEEFFVSSTLVELIFFYFF